MQVIMSKDEIVPSRRVVFVEFNKLELLRSICRRKETQDKIQK